jgi:hypothetical protein
MAHYERAPQSVVELASEILCEFETHKPLLDCRVKVDYIFAWCEKEGGVAIRYHGAQALGLCRRLSLKHRVMGRGDAEILVDGEWWMKASKAERRALLDHELHHIEVNTKKTDAAGRPVLRLRKHDVEIGWFKIVAERHGQHSIERMQARMMMDQHGQSFWPDLVGK